MIDPAEPTPLAETWRNSERWHAVLARDAAAAARFVYAVCTTGIYCRPGCPSRLPRRANVSFYASAAEAQAAGYRPCKRCRPDLPAGRNAAGPAVAAACRRIENQPQLPLAALARRLHLSSATLRRRFRQALGLTPRQYAMAVRAAQLREQLATRVGVTEAGYAAGFASSGHLHEHARPALGMTPSDYRDGGPQAVIRFAIGQSTLGAILVAGTKAGICAIALGDDPQALLRGLQDRFAEAQLIGDDAVFQRHVATVAGCVERPVEPLDLPLDIQGTAFQARVWQALRDIPLGATTSYADIAARIGAPRSARAVARACGANPLAIAIPCHRVVRADGALSGYRWGVARKAALLERERNAGPPQD